MADRLILLPGLGCDGRLWGPLREHGLAIDTPAWLGPRPREPLADYARRFAATLPADEPFFLGGTSFGGFVAMEIARHVTPRALFLMATATSGQAVRAWVRRLEPWLGWLPSPLFKPAAAVAIGSTLAWEPLTPEHRNLLIRMGIDTPAPFFRWATLAVPRWHFPGLDQLPCPIHQIHGRRDGLIPLGNMTPQAVIEDGGHLISLTHAAAVARFIGDNMRS